MEQIKQYDLKSTIGFFNIGSVSFDAHIQKENYCLLDNNIALTSVSQQPNIAKDREIYVHFSSDKTALDLEDFWVFTLQSYRRYGTDLRLPKEDLLKYYSKNTRKSIRIAREKMTERGEVTLEHYSHVDDILTHYKRIQTISAQTYQEQFLNLYLPSPDDILHNPHSQELFILTCGGMDVAYLLCSSRSHKILSTEYTGYLSTYKDASPGTYMKWLVLEKLIADEQYAFIEYETGQNHHKMRFSNLFSSCSDRIYVRKTIKNMLKIMPWLICMGCDKFLDYILKKLELKNKIRQFFIRRTGHKE